MLVVTTPARAAQKVATRVADMARRSYMKVVGVVENMSEFVAPDGSRHAVFGEGGGAALADEIGVPLVARIPIEPAVSSGGDIGRPVALDAPDSPAGRAFADLAARIVDELLPPIEMAGCTARLLDLVGQIDRPDALTDANEPGPEPGLVACLPSAVSADGEVAVEALGVVVVRRVVAAGAEVAVVARPARSTRGRPMPPGAMPSTPPTSTPGASPAGAVPVLKNSLKYVFASSNVLPAASCTSWKPCGVVPSFVTFSVRLLAGVAVGTVIAVSVIDTSATPSVGGLRFDLPETVKTLNMPCAVCGVPSGAGMKHASPYVPGGELGHHGRLLPGSDHAGRARHVGVGRRDLLERRSRRWGASAFLNCAFVVPFLSRNTTIMWSSTPALSKSIWVQPALGLPLSW